MRFSDISHGLAVALSSLLLSGCASTPYIANTRPDLTDGRTRIADASLKRGSMDYAIALADNTFDAYQAKLDEEFKRQQRLSNGLLALGTILVGAAAGSAHRDVFITGALGGGLAYQLGTWNSNADRLGIYLEGMKALTCAKSAIAPLRWSSTQTSRVRTLTTDGYTSLADAADAVGEVTAWLALAGAESPTPSELVKAARAELEQSTRLFTQGNELLGRAAATAGRVDGAGALLEQHVETVQRQINEALKGTLADLKQLPAQISAIGQYANIFAPGLKFDAALGQRIDAISKKIAPAGGAAEGMTKEATAAAAARIDPQARLASALGGLRAASLKLSASLAQLQGALDNAASAQVQDSLKGCGVDPAKLTSTLRLDRDSVTLRGGSAQSTVVMAAGGTSPYAASILESPHDGVTAEVLAGTGQVRVAIAASVAGDQSFTARVADATGQAANLGIRISAPAAASTGTKEGLSQPGDRPSCAEPGRFNKTQLCLVQKQIAGMINGRLDGATCRAFQASRYGATGKLDTDSWRQIAQSAGLQETASEQDIRVQMDPTEVTACNTGIGRRGVPRSIQPKAVVMPATTAATAATAASGPRTEFEKRLSEAQIRQRRLQLGLPGDPPLLDDRFRDELSKRQRENRTQQTNGTLDEETMQMLEKLRTSAPTP